MTNILILCTGNSARSIMGEAIANLLGEGRLNAYSAGSHPKTEPHPAALALLKAKNYEISGFRSKSWDEFVGHDAPDIDIVITVCDNAAGEICPIFPGSSIKCHWGIADPAAVEGEGQEQAFETAYRLLEDRIESLLALDFEKLDASDLRDSLNKIGRMPGATQLVADV